VQDKARAEGVRRNKIIGYCDVVVSYPQKNITVKKVVKEHITSFENGLLASGDQVMIEYNFKSCRRKAKVPDKVHDSQVAMDFTNFRTW
jgi:vancomycin permeability regulator SanA